MEAKQHSSSKVEISYLVHAYGITRDQARRLIGRIGNNQRAPSQLIGEHSVLPAGAETQEIELARISQRVSGHFPIRSVVDA